MSQGSVSPQDALRARLRELRDEAAVSQQELATAARHYGLEWTRDTVAAIEIGRRDIQLDELLLLPLIATKAFGRPTKLAHFFPDAGPQIRAGRATITPKGVRDFLASRPLPQPAESPEFESFEELVEWRRELARVPDVAEIKAARAIKQGVTPEQVMKAARAKWSRSLADERDRRFAKLDLQPATDREEAGLKSRITTELLRELEPQLVKRRKGKR